MGVGLGALLLPPIVACATGGEGDVPDGGFFEGGIGDATQLGDGGDGGPHKGKHDGSTGDGENGCDPKAECCTAAQCPPTAHVQTALCQDGKCVISTCAPGWYDYDASYRGGCNCHGSDDTSCGTATAVPALALGGSTTVSGTLPTASSENWFQITFGGDAKDKSYHPSITFMKNPKNELVFDVASDCSDTHLSCADLEAGVGLTTWEEFYAPGDAGTGPDASVFIPIPPVGAAGVVYVRVYRASSAADCDEYVLTVSD